MKAQKIIPWILLIFLVVSAVSLFSTGKVGANLKINNPTADAREAGQIAFLEKALSQELDPQSRVALENKLNAREFIANTRATAQAMTPRTLEEICAGRVQLPQPAADLVSGIINVRPDFMATQNLNISNMWRGEIGGHHAELYAGVNLQNADQGLVILSIEALNIYQTFLDPQPDGILELVAEHNLRIELRSSSGATRYFDIPAQQFTNDPTAMVAVKDLPPAPTAIADPCAQFDAP